MGMDVTHLKFFGFQTNKNSFENILAEQEKNFLEMDVSERNMSWLKAQGFIQEMHQFDVEVVDIDEMERIDPEIKGMWIGQYNLIKEEGDMWMEFMNDNQTVLFDESKIVFKKIPKVLIQTEEVGYMRKPFNFYDDAPVIMPNEVTLNINNFVMSANNFTKEGKGVFHVMNAIDKKQTEECNLFVFEKDQMEKMLPFVQLKESFKNEFLNDFDERSFVWFNW